MALPIYRPLSRRLRIFVKLLVWKVDQIFRAMRGRKGGRFSPRAIKNYWAEMTIEGYPQKSTNLHSSEVLELEAGRGWSDRVLELADLVPGDTVFEMGSGDGLLATQLWQREKTVVAADLSPMRHQTAERLVRHLSGSKSPRSRITLLNMDVANALEKAGSMETFVAVHVLYHYRSERAVKSVMRLVSERFDNVVLVGNAQKETAYNGFESSFRLSPVKFHWFAGEQGMSHLLRQFGYEVESGRTIAGDAYVLGKRSNKRTGGNLCCLVESQKGPGL